MIAALWWIGAAVSAAPTGAAPVDLQGVWQLAVPMQTLRPVSGAIPFNAEGRGRFERNKRLKARGRYEDYDITRARCSTPGVPRLMLIPTRFKIWQQLGVVTFDFEWNRAIRQIDVRGIKTEDKLIPDMTGTSKGAWEGDTLVAVTNDFLGRALWDDYMPQSSDAKVTERFRLIDHETLEDRVTIEDPAIFTRAWDATLTFKRQPDTLFADDICLDRLDAGKPTLPK